MPNSRDFMSEEEAFGPGSGLTPAPNAAPVIPTQPSNIAPNLQGTISPSFQHDVSYVGTAQNSPTGPNFSMMPLGPQNSVSSAQIQSTIKLAPGSSTTPGAAAGSISLDIPSIFTPTSQTKDFPDPTLAFGLTPELQNTVFSGPIPANPSINSLDFFIGTAAANAANTTGTITLTPLAATPVSQDLCFLLTSGVPLTTPPSGWAYVDIIDGTPLYYQVSSAAITSGTNTFASIRDNSAAQMIFGFNYPTAGTPTFTKIANGGGAWSTSVPLTLSATYPANAIILVLQQITDLFDGAGSAAYAGTTVSDNVNSYYKIGEYFTQQHDPINAVYYGSSVAAWLCPATAAGTFGVQFIPNEGGSTTVAGASAEIYLITGIGPISAIPTFKDIRSFLGGSLVTSLNSETGALTLTGGTDITVLTNGTNISVSFTGTLPTFGGVNAQTGSYSIASGDTGKLITLTSGTGTFGLPNTPPSATFSIFVENSGAGVLTLSPGTANLDGVNTALTIPPNQGVYVSTDGTNYFTERGLVTSSSAVTSLNTLTGAVVLESTGGTIAITNPSGSNINLDVVAVPLSALSITVNAQSSTTYTVLTGDRGKLITFNVAQPSSVAVTLPQAGSAGFAAGWYATFTNINTGAVTITPTTSTINTYASIVLERNQAVTVVSDGANYEVFGWFTSITPTANQILTFNASDGQWEPKGLGSIGGANATYFEGVPISSSTPTDQQLFRYSSTDGQYDLVYADGLYHGDTIFDVDSSYLLWKDDFIRGTATSQSSATSVTGSSNIGELNWDFCVLGSGTTLGKVGVGTTIFNRGFVSITVETGQYLGGTMFWPNGSTAFVPAGNFSSGSASSAMPLIENPGWKMVWVFAFPTTVANVTATQQTTLTKKQLYIGLSSPGMFTVNTENWSPNQSANNVFNARPPIFLGLRYDTDPGVTIACSAAGNASSGLTTYTITAPLVNTVGPGTTVTVAGFVAHTGNNGTFTVNSYTQSATSIVLNNAAGVAESHVATITTPSIADTTFNFEVVQNPNLQSARNNGQGTVSNTNITPTIGVSYRLEMLCNAAGQIVMTLSGNGQSATHTFTSIPQSTFTMSSSTGGASMYLQRENGYGELEFSSGPGAAMTQYYTATTETNPTIVPGSHITVSGSTGSEFNSSFIISGLDYTNAGGGWTWVLPGATASDLTKVATVSFYPAVIPYFGFGNDSQTAGTLYGSCAIDFFALLISPSLMTSPVQFISTDSRYWSGS